MNFVLKYDWNGFKNELVTYNNELTFAPHRSFLFGSRHTCDLNDVATQTEVNENSSYFNFRIHLDQYAGDVGSIIWDAEVILAKYMYSKFINITNVDDKNNISILELGAGCGLASIVCCKLNINGSFHVQELKHVLPHTKRCINMNRIETITEDMEMSSVVDKINMTNSTNNSNETTIKIFNCMDNDIISDAVLSKNTLNSNYNNNDDNVNEVSSSTIHVYEARWGNDAITKLTKSNQSYNYVMISDVLYHVEDFADLLDTILKCVYKPNSSSPSSSPSMVIISYEKRRKNVNFFFEKLERYFRSHKMFVYQIQSSDSNSDTKFTEFNIHEFSHYVNPSD